MPDLYTTGANFKAQLLIATGRFEDAESILKDALALPFQEDEASMNRSYLLALLGKLYLEWGRVEDAVEILKPAFEQTRDSLNTAVVPLIRNYYCELLLDERASAYDLEGAVRLLDLTIQETSQSGFRRSEVVARMLMAVAHGQRNCAVEALLSSTRAIMLLDETGTLPAVRTEEVLFIQYKCSAAVGDTVAAGWFLSRAKEELMRKAGSMADPTARTFFLERVPISRVIASASSDETFAG